MQSSFRRPITLRHKAPGHYENGEWIEGLFEESTIYASVQPASPNAMQSLPQGRREDKTYVLYTQAKLESVDSENPDVVVLFEEEYEIINVEAWQNTSLSHYRCLASRKRSS